MFRSLDVSHHGRDCICDRRDHSASAMRRLPLLSFSSGCFHGIQRSAHVHVTCLVFRGDGKGQRQRNVEKEKQKNEQQTVTMAFTVSFEWEFRLVSESCQNFKNFPSRSTKQGF